MAPSTTPKKTTTTISISNTCEKCEKRITDKEHPYWFHWGVRVLLNKEMADLVDRITYTYTWLEVCDQRRALVRSKDHPGLFKSTKNYASWGLYMIKVRIYFRHPVCLIGKETKKLIRKHMLDFDVGKNHTTHHTITWIDPEAPNAAGSFDDGDASDSDATTASAPATAPDVPDATTASNGGGHKGTNKKETDQTGTKLKCTEKEPLDWRQRIKAARNAIMEACQEDGLAYKDASELHKGDREIAIAAVSNNGLALQFAPKALQNDFLIVLAACSQDGQALQFASPNLKGDKTIVLKACTKDGLALKHASNELQDDKEVVLAACSQRGYSLKYASYSLQNDPEVVLTACMKDASALQFATYELRGKKDILLAACSRQGSMLQFASKQLRKEKDVVLAACRQDGSALQFATGELRYNKEIVLAACSQNGYALQLASSKLRKDKEVVLAACSQDGNVLKFAPEELRNDKAVVLAACTQNGFALKHATQEIQSNRAFMLVACSLCGHLLEHATKQIQNDKEIVLAACTQNGYALQFASELLRADKEVVMAAAGSKPESLKFARSGLNQDKDCLIKAKLWDEDYTTYAWNSQIKRKIVLSTRFSLAAESSAHATRFAVELKKNPYIESGNFVVYSPNAFNKGTCDPEWTNIDWPCRGTYATCQKQPMYKSGVPQSECCWRYSFRYHLRAAYRSGGFMIQVVDRELKYDKNERGFVPTLTLGDGQKIETEMAHDVGIKVFQFYEPADGDNSKYVMAVNQLVAETQDWWNHQRSSFEKVRPV